MDNNKPKKPRYMDIVGGKRPARPVQPKPSTPQATATKVVRQWNVQRPVSSYADPIAARPVSRPAGPGHAVPRPASALSRPVSKFSRPAPTPSRPAPVITRSTTVKTVAATKDKVESVEFGVIEDLTPVVKPEPPMVPGTRPQPPVSADKKSPFLTSVKVSKRPLSASAPTGINAPAPKKVEEPKAEKPKKKRKNAPFIVIIILSVFLGVSLGALVYFVLPH